MSNTFTVRNTQGTIVATIAETLEDNVKSTSLVLHGRGNKQYGGERDENLVWLLETFSSSTPPSNPMNGQLWWNRSDRDLYIYDTSGSPLWHAVVPPAADLGFTIIAGAGLTGGGIPIGSPITLTINVVGGTGITVAANTVSTVDSEIIHDNLLNFVADEHVDHTSVSLIAGNGLTGGGTLASSRTLDIGAGTGISVASNAVSVNSQVVRTTGNQTIGGVKSWHAQLQGESTNSASSPAWSFSNDTNTGFYRSAVNELSFATAGAQRFRIESNGVLRSLNSSYESLVTHDDDIPNKKYVDDSASAGGSVPTQNQHTGTGIVAGLTVGKTYLVSGYGTTRNKGNGNATLFGARVGTGTTVGGGATLAQTPSLFINWHDGQGTQSATFVITATTSSMNFAPDWENSVSRGTPLDMVAIQLD